VQRKLPILLDKEPLLDAIFEIRFAGITNVADLLAGYLFHVLQPGTPLMRLPAADMPQSVRSSDPALHYLPTVRIDWGKFNISFGDRNVILACKLPYPKWPDFKSSILRLVNEISKIGSDYQVERYSLKYVNVIPSENIADQIKKIRLDISIGDIEVKEEHLSLEVHRREEDYLHIMTIVTGAQGQIIGGNTFRGVVVDIDSIAEIALTDFNSFNDKMSQNIESLRQANKAKFFACLTEQTIEEMGPTYA